MKYLESDNQVIAYGMYDQGSPDPWNIIYFLNKFQDKKIIFVDLLEFHPYYALRTNKDLHRYYVNNIIARNRLKVEYWISLQSNHRHEEFYNYIDS